MDLSRMQTEIDAWIQDNGGYWPPLSQLARLTEELGELARVLNHEVGPKKKKSTEADQDLGEEMADVLFTLICLANQMDVDLDVAFERTLNKVVRRDSGRFTS